MTSTIPSDPRLAAYITNGKFPGGNPFAIHYRQQIQQTDGKPFVAQATQWLKDIHAGSTLIAAPDWLQIMKAAVPAWQAGILPLCRLICKINGPHDFLVGVKALKDSGIPAWVQIFNEPGINVEWKNDNTPKGSIKTFGASWASNAAQIFDADGYPGLQVLGKDEFDAAIGSLRGMNRMDVLQKTWFAVHNYWENKPLSYPYDPRNQRDHPGATIMDDDTAFLRPLEYAQWCLNSFGFVLPMIGAEGGTNIGASADNRYPVMTEDIYAAQLVAIYNAWRTGILPNGFLLADWWFTPVAPWIMGDSSSQSFNWWVPTPNWPSPNLSKTVSAVAGIPRFVRQFGYADPPAPPPPPPTHTPLTDAALAALVVGAAFAQPDVAMAIILAESGGDPQATNTEGNTPPSTDRGLWQFNSYYHDEVTDACAFDLTCATQAAYNVSDGGTNWSQWAAYRAGTYQAFMARAQAAISALSPPPPPVHTCPDGQHWDDASASCVADEPPPPLPPPDSELFIDPRLTWVMVTQPQVSNYRVREVWFYDSKPVDDPESEGGIDIYVVVRDSKGIPVEHEAVTQIWPTGSATHYTRNGAAQFQMSGDSSFSPERGEVGPYTIRVGDAHVGGLGLPLKQHVLYMIVVVKPA